MPKSPPRPCSMCGKPVVRSGKCSKHYSQADRRRGTATQRGYTSREHREDFRAVILARDPICVECGEAPATQADHFPRTRRQLIADGDNPNDPRWGRGLCGSCHSRHTANTTPGFGRSATH
jgi:5-methylcytosine-specific restriction protein A